MSCILKTLFLFCFDCSGRMSRAGGRLTELPMRVQDSNRMSMANATPQSKPFGRLSIQKPLSVTSERRTSFFGARTSGAGMHGTMSGFGGTEKIKDVRPLHDKSYVQQCIRQLHEFLTDHGFPGPLSSKTLQSPSTKEFVKMFEFVYRMLDDTFEMPKQKVEEEVPAILKALRYPFVLSKVSMYSVGAPHTWPQALGALMWLIDNVKVRNYFLGALKNCPNLNKLNGICITSKRSLCAFAEKLYNVDEAYLASVEEKHAYLSQEVERLEKESQTDRLMSKRMEKVKLQSDLKKLQDYKSNLESFKTNLESKVTELTEDLENTASHLESLKHERGELQVRLQNQKFTPADVERINREKNELQQTISSLSKGLEEAEQHKWNEEIALAKVKEKLELRLAEYHKLARKLKLIPISAENACGHDFEIRPGDNTSSNVLQHRTQIQMPLRKLISDVEEENSRMTNMKLSLEENHSFSLFYG
uniref:Kinetochore protein NDC80 n=1 Tax=Neogobius melanostomus TaxID=47308 RepID=A0A8C6SXJ4_9GOBI